ncbi:hypothetical protein COEREDRAFT_5692 [Coemansia reversa NRRL 1564]|uniref:Arrestin-like N-terminal domain-containing protein n=1 Tax=Coemansia reversa (strain ATCC 12441 / NRRL 1564) TaxID=763665 RepID=A0A2G5BJH7_COERN|nr:hypothetical protein COEREDRAFT_5692 [Coemansia reversa NRRL 1564]|eukprot:PIA19168.1 hypothetical protein COEREDRAFT_5692 [Coemansia reversa NRRL 1564]
MALDPRIKTFKLEFPIRKPSMGLKPMRTYHGRIKVEVSEPIAINQLRVQFEGWESIDFGSKIGATRKPIFRSSEDLLQGGGMVVDTIARDATFDFSCTMPNVNYPSAMQSTICEIVYTVSASLVGSSRPSSAMTSGPSTEVSVQARPESSCANHVVPLATDTLKVQLMPRVLPSGVGWLKPMVMRDGVVLSEPVRRRFRRHTVQTAMNICVQVRNHCCTLGEAISVDIDATLLQKDRVLTFVRAAIIEQVSLKTQVQDAQALEIINAFVSSGQHEQKQSSQQQQQQQQASTVILAERTLNRKVSELDPSALSGLAAKDWGLSHNTYSGESPILGLDRVQNLHIRVPRRDVCTAEGFFLKFSHVLRLTFGLTSRPSNGRFDTKYATKDVPLRLVTSKFGDVGRMSQVEINKRLSALTTESDGSMVSEAYGYLLSENSRAVRPTPLESLASTSEMPAPSIVAVVNPSCRLYTPVARPMSSGMYTFATSTMTSSSHMLRPNSLPSHGNVRSISSLITPDTPTLMTGAAAQRMLVESASFESKPLPPVPSGSGEQLATLSGGMSELPTSDYECAIVGSVLDVPSDQTDASRPESPAESVLYMNNRLSGSQYSDCSRALNRDTLVDTHPDPVGAKPELHSHPSSDSIDNDDAEAATKQSRSQSPLSLLSSSGSMEDISSSSVEEDIDTSGSYMSLDDQLQERSPSPPQHHEEAIRRPQEVLPTPISPTFRKIQTASSPRFNDKRGSSQSEGETIVYSPRSDTNDDEQDVLSIQSITPIIKRPELPELPAMESLSEMTKDMLGSTSVFVDNNELSSFWSSANL